MSTSDLKSFNYLEDGSVTFSILDTIKTIKSLDKGIYKLDWIDYPQYIVTVKKDIDIELPRIHTFLYKQKIDQLLESFFDKNVVDMVSNKWGFCHKVGILFYGKEGCGKTSIMKYYYNVLVNQHNGLVFHISNAKYLVNIWKFVASVRKIQNNPIVILFDEFDVFMEEREAQMKSILDGLDSIDNCIFFAATNYIQKIPHALRNRPSRFKYVLDIGGIESSKDVYDIIAPLLSQFNTNELNSFSEKLKGETIDFIKQFCLDKIMKLDSEIVAKNRIGFKKDEEENNP